MQISVPTSKFSKICDKIIFSLFFAAVALNVNADIEDESLKGNTCSTPEERKKVEEAIRKQVE